MEFNFLHARAPARTKEGYQPVSVRNTNRSDSIQPLRIQDDGRFAGSAWPSRDGNNSTVRREVSITCSSHDGHSVVGGSQDSQSQRQDEEKFRDSMELLFIFPGDRRTTGKTGKNRRFFTIKQVLSWFLMLSRVFSYRVEMSAQDPYRLMRSMHRAYSGKYRLAFLIDMSSFSFNLLSLGLQGH